MGGREKAKLFAPKGKRESSPLEPIPLGNQTTRTHARTKRNDFLVEHPPISDHIVINAAGAICQGDLS